jgi:hypothetical protein
MTSYPISGGYVIIDEFKFKIGDLVSTILGEFGIIIKIGKHEKYRIDDTNYYHVLIDDRIQCFLPFALIKIKNKKCLTKANR